MCIVYGLKSSVYTVFLMTNCDFLFSTITPTFSPFYATGLGYRYPKYRMSYAGLKLYLCCTELVQFDELFDYLELPDTYLSYFLLLHLHVWLIMTRLAQEGDEGKFIKVCGLV